MNRYFSKVTSDHWCPKNKLQAEAQLLARKHERKIILENELEIFISSFKVELSALNVKYHRCNPLVMQDTAQYHPSDKDRRLSVSGVFHLTFYQENESVN